MGEKVNINSRSINLALSHSFDEPKTARYRSPFFNGSSIIGLLATVIFYERAVYTRTRLLKCLKIMNYAYSGLSIVTWHFLSNNLQSLFHYCRGIRYPM